MKKNTIWGIVILLIAVFLIILGIMNLEVTEAKPYLIIGVGAYGLYFGIGKLRKKTT